ncbi:MAG: NADH:ubiquinone reductase (Na(+)-transporting) subunit C [Parachlamydia sp.]|nr:NADH:ubiquinone reductase (Na(+)-transporting) subunit C [Parachlamydia sp.]
MSDAPPSTPSSNVQTIVFMVILSFVCALILSLLASALAKPKEVAKELDRSKQMMIAAHILDHDGHFLMQDSEGKSVPARYQDGLLVPGTGKETATRDQLIDIYQKRFKPILVDAKGGVTTFEKEGINPDFYITEHRKTGYYKQPYKLLYEILPNAKDETKPEGYVIPVNGLGLWDAIFGYLALSPDGNTVIGISWYDQKETPGLGANIAEKPWQMNFPGKKIFQESATASADLKTAPLGIVVVKGKVTDVYGEAPKSKSAVDGMAGATLTGNGVTDAYRDVLAAYRPFLMKVNSESKKNKE